MTRWLAGLALALAPALMIWPAPARAAERAVVLDNASELRQGYCEGTITAQDGGKATLAIESCAQGGIAGVTPGTTQSFPEADVLAAQQGLAVAGARKRFFASPRIAAILRGGYVPAGGEDLTALATLAGQADLADWHAFIGMLQPIANLSGALHHKRIADYSSDDFHKAMDAYGRFAADEDTAISDYAAAIADLHAPGPRRGPGLGAAMLVQSAMRGYDLPFAPAMPDAWLQLQQRAARTGSAILAAYRRALTPLGLSPFFVSELRSQEQSGARIRQRAERTYAKAAQQTALGVLTDAEFDKPDAAILADVERAVAPYTQAKPAALAFAKAEIAHTRRLIAVSDRTMAAMHGRHWQLTIAETDGDPVRHYTMVFTRTGTHALGAKVYEQDMQTGNPILIYTWPVYVQADGDIKVHSSVSGVDNDFVIPAKAFATGRFRVRSEGFSEVFNAGGTLRRDAPVR